LQFLAPWLSGVTIVAAPLIGFVHWQLLEQDESEQEIMPIAAISKTLLKIVFFILFFAGYIPSALRFLFVKKVFYLKR